MPIEVIEVEIPGIQGQSPFVVVQAFTEEAIQAAVDFVRDNSSGGGVFLPKGIYPIEHLDLYPSVPLHFWMEHGARLNVLATGASNVALQVSHPTAPLANPPAQQMHFTNLQMQFDPSVPSDAIGAVFLEARRTNFLTFDGFNLFQYGHHRNTAVRLSSVFNGSLNGEFFVQQAGDNRPRKVTAGVTFTWDGTQIIASGPIFDSTTDLDQPLMLVGGGGNSEICKIKTVTDSTHAIPYQPCFFTHVANSVGSFGPAKGYIDATSNLFTFSQSVAPEAADVGRAVIIDGAGVGGRTLRAYVTAVDTVAGTYTLDRNASTAVLASAPGYIFVSPAVEIYTDDSPAVPTNDIRIAQWHIEDNHGLPFYGQDLAHIQLALSKIHGSLQTDYKAVAALALIDNAAGYLMASWDQGTTIPEGRILIRNQNDGWKLKFTEIEGFTPAGVPLVDVRRGNANGVVVIGDILTLQQGTIPTADNLINGDGSTRVFFDGTGGLGLAGLGQGKFDAQRNAEIGSAAFAEVAQLLDWPHETTSGIRTLTDQDVRKIISGSSAITLPAAADCRRYWEVRIRARGGDVSVTRQGSDTVEGGSSITVGDGTTALIKRDSSSTFITVSP